MALYSPTDEKLDCSYCVFAACNCKDASIRCEDESGLCDDFECVGEKEE